MIEIYRRSRDLEPKVNKFPNPETRESMRFTINKYGFDDDYVVKTDNQTYTTNKEKAIQIYKREVSSHFEIRNHNYALDKERFNNPYLRQKYQLMEKEPGRYELFEDGKYVCRGEQEELEQLAEEFRYQQVKELIETYPKWSQLLTDMWGEQWEEYWNEYIKR